MSARLEGGIAFSIGPVGQFLISENIVTQLQNFRQNNSDDAEAGGILLGRQFVNKADIVVDEITAPLITDKRSRYRFYRSKGHNDFAVERWKESNGTCLYLGLWHTHPEGVPSPSSLDLDDWKKAMHKGKFEGNNLFFIIVGTEQICCWKGVRPSKFERVIGVENKFKQLSILHE